MKQRSVYGWLLVLAALYIVGCGGEKKAAPAPIEGLEMYSDDVLHFGIKHPTNWQKAYSPGKEAVFFSDQNVSQRFVQYDASGPGGARVRISAEKMPGGTLDQAIEKAKNFESKVYSALENATVGGMEGKKIAYSFDLQDGKFMGEKYFAMKGDIVTIVEFEAFGGTFDALRPQFDEMLKSVQLAEEKQAAPSGDTTKTAEAPKFIPSATVTTYKGTGFTMQIPDNFSGSPKAGKALSTIQFKGIGGPADCTIQVDVLDASKQKDLNKIIESNKAVYKANPVATTLGGEKAYYMNYSLRSDAGSRVYFAIKGDKLYRVTMNWFKPEQDVYLPPFEKSVGTFKFE